MITKFKLYETINEDGPKIGDYVIVKYNSGNIKKSSFIENSVSKIFKQSEHYFYVKYYNIPEELIKDFKYSDYSDGLKIGNAIFISKNDILYWSENKEDLEEILATKKYNL